ncbi:MAG: hypothetical protein GY899_02495 [Verrucomicrobiaceae bacterium]|nr:hypothetical protein [Verrucomicrobiaceae bacterium]
MKNFKVYFCAIILGIPALTTIHAAQVEIYFTDFEDAPSGDDQLVGYDDWNGNPTNRGCHGIDSEAVPGLGKSAFIGYNSPGNSSTSAVVLRSIPHDPVATGRPIIRLVAAIGLNDSDDESPLGDDPDRDSFFIAFFNSAGQRLASLNYNNTEDAFGLWRDDGIDTFDTEEEFIRNEVQILVAEIDFLSNTWSVDLGGFQIFRDQPFTAKTGVDMDLGGTAITWQRSLGSNWGNNWMLFDYWTVYADTSKLAISEDNFHINSITRSGAGNITLEWKSQPGFLYQVEYSDDMINWKSDLPNSLIEEPVNRETSYTDITTAQARVRGYRITRATAGQ